jgi:hypothetical protein
MGTELVATEESVVSQPKNLSQSGMRGTTIGAPVVIGQQQCRRPPVRGQSGRKKKSQRVESTGDFALWTYGALVVVLAVSDPSDAHQRRQDGLEELDGRWRSHSSLHRCIYSNPCLEQRNVKQRNGKIIGKGIGIQWQNRGIKNT